MKEEKIYKDRRYRINELRAKNEKMTARQRTLNAINFKEPDRIPIDNWMVPEIKKRCMDYWGCESEDELLAFLVAERQMARIFVKSQGTIYQIIFNSY